MQNYRVSIFLNRVIEIGWLLVFGLCPIFFSLICYSDFVISQYFLFCLLTEVILFFCLVKIILTFGGRVSKWRLDPQTLRFIIPACIFIAILGLAVIFSQSPYTSFWGKYSRKMGYLTWLHFFIFFLILFFNIKNNKQIKRVLKTILFSSLMVIVYGFCQFLNFDFVHWLEPPSQTFRIFSTIGQPNFLGSWLILVIPVILYFLIRTSEKFRKNKSVKRQMTSILVVSLLFCAIFSLALTQSRGAWVGLFFSFFFFSIIYNLLKKQKRIASLLIILLAVTVIFVVYMNFNPLYSRSSDSFLVSRFKSLTNLRYSTTGQARIISWQAAWDLIKQKPILGYGPETQFFNFFKYYIPKYALLEKINSYPDRAHNDFLDTLLVSGILGLISYLFLIVSVFYFGLKNIFKSVINYQQSMILCLLTGLTGYLISLQFSFHVVPTAIYFWGYMAIILKVIILDKKV